ncbi:MAG: DUF6273 domain-containing protein [Ruminococcus flavefaciens]|nr:DUF6273 domain-containing protein [Ruminococcus flavefaciens]
MIETICTDKYGQPIEHLTQWDCNIHLYLDNQNYETAPVFHLYNKNTRSAPFEVQGEFIDSRIRFSVPNELLEQSYTIYCNGYCDGKSFACIRIPIHPRMKAISLCTINFYNDDTLLYSIEDVIYGSKITYEGEVPIKQGVSNPNSYQFIGWSEPVEIALGDVNCRALFYNSDMPDTIKDSWEEIISSTKDGSYLTKYKIGDTKQIDLDKEGSVNMKIVAFDSDVLNDGSKAHITWIAETPLKTFSRMNPTFEKNQTGTGSIGGWKSSEMRTYVNNNIKALIPANVRSELKSVSKVSQCYNKDGTGYIDTTIDKIWIPSYREISCDGAKENTGAMYNKAFSDNKSRIRNSIPWWTRSAENTECFRRVGSNGKIED